MDYEKKYKDAVEKIQDLLKRRSIERLMYCKSEFEEILPELIGNRNEQIRKALIELLEKYSNEWSNFNHVDIKDMITWVENQGEQKSVNWNETDEMMIKFTLTHFRKEGATEDSDIINWLKNIKTRFNSQPVSVTIIPSKAELNALDKAASELHNNDLISLHNKLINL